MSDWIDRSRQDYKDLQKSIQQVQSGSVDINQYIQDAKDFSSESGDGKLVLADIDLDDRKILSDLGDRIRDKVQSGIVVVVGKGESSHPIIVNVTKNLTKTYNAGKIIREMANEMGGKGGGRPDFAQGAAKDRSKLTSAFEIVKKFVQ